MMIDDVLVQIMSTKSNKVYRAWLKDKRNKTMVFDTPQDGVEKGKFLKDRNNLFISKTIDRINEKIGG